MPGPGARLISDEMDEISELFKEKTVLVTVGPFAQWRFCGYSGL